MAITKHIRQPIDVTYSELVTLIDSSGLTEGQQYRITDFQTVHYMLDWNHGFTAEASVNYGSVEPLFITSISANELSHLVYSQFYPYDEILYDWDPSNWINDVAFNEVPDFKGVIYMRHDKKRDIKCTYDFRNVKFRRWQIDKDTPGWRTFRYIVPYSEWTITAGEDTSTFEYNTLSSYIDYYTFTNISGTDKTNSEDFGKIDIGESKEYFSLLTNNVFFERAEDVRLGTDCICNTFGGDTTAMEKGVKSLEMEGYSSFGNILGVTRDCKFGQLIIGNIIRECTDVRIGSDWFWNIISGEFYMCRLGSEWYYNWTRGAEYSTFGSGYWNNTFGANWSENKIGDYYWNNIITECRSSIIGNWYENNRIFKINYSVIGNGFTNNTITGGTILSITIGNEFANNTINVSSFRYNTIGNGFDNNTLSGDTITYNTFNNGIDYVDILGNFSGNLIRDNFGGTSISGLTISSSIPGISDATINVEFYLGTTNTKRAKLTNSTDDIVIYDAETGSLLKTFSGV